MKISDFFKRRLKKRGDSVQGIDKVLQKSNLQVSKMETAIDLWASMYKDQAPWLQQPSQEAPAKIASLGLPAFIASEKARMATLEAKIKITDPSQPEADQDENEEPKTRAAYLDKQFDKVRDTIRTQLEYGAAKGGLVIKPYPVVDASGQMVFEYDYVQAEDFRPLAFDGSGRMTEAVFFQRKTTDDAIYTRAEYHRLDGNRVIIENKAFRSYIREREAFNKRTAMGSEIPLSEVPEWADIEPIAELTGMDHLMFAYFKMPEANTIDQYSALGVSCYARATSLIEEADRQYSRLLWEFEGGELAIDVDRDAMKPVSLPDGTTLSMLPEGRERLFRTIDLNADDTYKVFSPALRDQSLLNGLNSILMRIEDVCALSRGTLVNMAAEARTATELKILKQRAYAANADLQKALGAALTDLLYIMNAYCDYYSLFPGGEYAVAFEWDDSILIDVDTELGHRILLQQNGLLGKVENRMWYTGETREQAEQALAEIEQSSLDSVEAQLQRQFGIAGGNQNG